MVVKPLFGAGQDDFKQAEWLADKLQKRWRYDFSTEKWHHWNGVRWEPKDKVYAAYAVATVAAKHLTGSSRENIARVDHEETRKALTKLLNLPPAYRALEGLSANDGYGTDGDDWDTDPYLLGCENGVVDLRTGQLNEHPDPGTLVTKTTGHNYVPLTGAVTEQSIRKRAPKFWKFLDDVTVTEELEKDPSMAMFLLQWFGSGMFGFTPEQKFVILTGIGRNGKGTLKNAVLEALGEYATQSDQNLYMRSRNGAATSHQARADLIDLKGKRIAFFSEPEGGRFNDELLKNHTGGDTIAARGLFSNVISHWKATHSITFLVNDLPTVDDVGPSMADRVLVADFHRRYERGGLTPPDTKLDEKLKAEAEGILAALVWAAGLWHARREADLSGLLVPERVSGESRSFIEQSNPVVQVIMEAFDRGRDYECAGQIAYDTYLEWFARSGEEGEPLTMVKFFKHLVKEGMRKRRTNRANVWTGLRPKSAVDVARAGAAWSQD